MTKISDKSSYQTFVDETDFVNSSPVQGKRSKNGYEQFDGEIAARRATTVAQTIARIAAFFTRR